MNTTGYEKTLRPVMSADELVRLYGIKRNGPIDPERLDEIAAACAAVFDIADGDELMGLVVDAGAIAADLAQPIGVRRLAATVALAAESRHEKGTCDWDRALDWLEAGEYLNYERTVANATHT